MERFLRVLTTDDQGRRRGNRISTLSLIGRLFEANPFTVRVEVTNNEGEVLVYQRETGS